MTKRRDFLLFLLLASGLVVLQPGAGSQALARDGDSGGGDSGGSRGGDSGNSGPGSANSGRSGGDDHGGGHGDDDNGGDDSSGGGSGRDHDDAREAVNEGRILRLKDVLRSVKASQQGTVIDIDLRRSGRLDIYRVKVRDEDGAIRTLRINARTGKQLNIFGF
ncbi:PepSY domain-containing protein [Pararhizobium sp.]|uniref:PepSY domain-containing protein n=1 Tax=Pararhizobium sp. TaxID=1977563 RepID=UPI0027224A0E|nr:hypothetical protein [Pararhizobium sp.]MDO9416430.1 hypothetical protein [Pararhizobium sp.]